MNTPATHSSTGVRSSAKVMWWLFASLTLIYVGVTRGHFVSTDEIMLYQMTRSVWERGELNVEIPKHSVRGRDGLLYSPYSVGQAVAATPLYGLGQLTRQGLEFAKADSWLVTFADREEGEEPSRWRGEVEIFFVNLFNAFATAGVCVAFFALSHLCLGASLPNSILASFLLGLTTHLASFSVGFFRHSVDIGLLLLALFYLMRDARRPARRDRFLAGLSVGLMLHFRYVSVIAWPVIVLWMIVTARRRHPPGWRGAASLVSDLSSFLVPIIASLILQLGFNWLRFESLLGGYELLGGQAATFDAPILRSIYAYLFSPGMSVFLFTPLLLLAPVLALHAWQRWRSLSVCIGSLSCCFVLVYGKYQFWHGMWHFGPRYLIPLTPLLLLPLASWMDSRGRKVWLLLVPLGLFGLWVQAAHVAVNFSYVFHRMGYPDYWPPESYLFIPETSQIVVHSKALFELDTTLIDMWLVNVFRQQGAGRFLTLAIPLAVLISISLQRLVAETRAAQRSSSIINSPQKG